MRQCKRRVPVALKKIVSGRQVRLQRENPNDGGGGGFTPPGDTMGEIDKDDLVHILDEDIKDDAPPTTLPMMPVRDVVIFTDMLMPLLVGRDKSVRAVEEAVEKEGYLFLVTQKDAATEDPKADDIYRFGTISRIEHDEFLA